RCQSTGLGMPDQPMAAATQLQTDLRQLGGLAGAGGSGDHHYLMLGNRLADFLPFGSNRQTVVIAQRRHTGCPAGSPRTGRRQTTLPLLQTAPVGILAKAL